MRNRILPIFFALFHIWRIVLSDTVKMEACAPVRCGSVDISYPLWIPHQQSEYCGYPTLEIDCRYDKPFLVQSYDANYYIDRVFYENSSFVLIDSILVDYKFNCSVPQFNVSLGLGPMVISKTNKELVFFFNCEKLAPPTADYLQVPCVTGQSDDVGNESFVRLFDNYNDVVNSFPGESLGNCNISRIPVSGWNGSGVDQYTTLMNDGFLGELKVTSCSDCQNSGGQCGFNTSSIMFMCICSDDNTYPMSCPNSKGTKSNTNIIVIGSTIAAALALVTISAVLIFKYERGCNFPRKPGEQKEIEMLIEKYGSLAPKRYNYRELKKITKSFQDKLGKGGFGTVYKGSLGDGCFVAVKILRNAKSNGEEFLNEVISIGRTSHVNVVNLLGFCIEGSKRALIYEYMPNGSLDNYIYSEIPTDILSWEKLYDIAISTARGIEYLHRGCNTRIVHFDIKPQNILLDEDFFPKISDFGLAKLCQQKESIISSLGEMRGTVGYIAPEVFSRSFGVPSTKSDVYSYGMMVLEMVGGRKNKNQIDGSSSKDYFPHWIYDGVAQGGDIQTCDVTVETEEIVRKMAIVGLWCIQTLPANRPSMSGVLEMMEKSFHELEMPPKPLLSSLEHSIILSLNPSSG